MNNNTLATIAKATVLTIAVVICAAVIVLTAALATIETRTPPVHNEPCKEIQQDAAS